MSEKVGFGGSCHWCTEAIFQSLKGVLKVDQGWIASDGDAESFSEAVVVEFDADLISLETLIDVHLQTHHCTANHHLRSKYRSAVYTFETEQSDRARKAIEKLQSAFDSPVITRVLPFRDFRLNTENYLDYYYKNPDKPFCENVISPKLALLRRTFPGNFNDSK